MSEVEIVAGTADDVRALARRRGFDEASYALAASLAEAGGAWTARDGGEVVGFALLKPSPEEHYVGDLYVEPSFRGAGVGAALLDAALAADTGGLTRSALCDPADPAGAALLLRRGLGIRGALLRVAGAIPREDALLAMAAGDYRFEIEPIDPVAHAFSLDALDRSVRAIARPADHAVFARDATGVAVQRNGEFVAYAYVWSDGRIGPLATFSAAYVVQLLALALATLQRTYGATWCTALIPASNVRCARAALRGGLEVTRTLLFASDNPEPDLSRYVAYHELAL